MLEIALKLGYVAIYIGCLIGVHYSVLPAGSEITAVALFAGDGVATAIAARKSNSTNQNQTIPGQGNSVPSASPIQQLDVRG